jgi:hypothetical protein
MTRLLLTLSLSCLAACDLPQQWTPTVNIEDLEIISKKQQWRHTCIEMYSADRVEAFDEDIGGSGWEMVSVAPFKDKLIACYKKPQTWKGRPLEGSGNEPTE